MFISFSTHITGECILEGSIQTAPHTTQPRERVPKKQRIGVKTQPVPKTGHLKRRFLRARSGDYDCVIVITTSYQGLVTLTKQGQKRKPHRRGDIENPHILHPSNRTPTLAEPTLTKLGLLNRAAGAAGMEV